MSIAMEALTSVGVTHQVLVLGALFFIIAAVIGLFWHYILPGALIIGALVLFYDPSMVKPDNTTPQVVQKAPEFDEHGAYIKDCVEVAAYSKEQCEALWLGHSIEEDSGKAEVKSEVDFKPISQVKFLDVENEEYKARRDEVAKNPNAVVYQATYH